MGFEGKGITTSDRRAERYPLDRQTRLRPNDWSSLEIRVTDFSRFGFQADCDARLIGSSIVSLDIPGLGPVSAQVRWQRDGQFGAQFLQPIDLGRCEWAGEGREAMLARLLFQRAEASRTGLGNEEDRLRREILDALPVWRGDRNDSGSVQQVALAEAEADAPVPPPAHDAIGPGPVLKLDPELLADHHFEFTLDHEPPARRVNRPHHHLLAPDAQLHIIDDAGDAVFGAMIGDARLLAWNDGSDEACRFLLWRTARRLLRCERRIGLQAVS